MKRPRLKTLLIAPLLLFAVFYLFLAVVVLLDDSVVEPLQTSPPMSVTVAIFGASGTAGDGILKAGLASPDIGDIRVFTRRTTPRIDQGVNMGKVSKTLHMDYLDYGGILDQLSDIDAVYWAIGTSSIGVDEETYGRIHVDFPVAFLTAWLSVSEKPAASFHYISSSDISADSSAMWAREKVRAEESLFALAEKSAMRVLAYRPDYIGPTEEEAHLGQDFLYGLFAPVGAAVKAEQIGLAMVEATARPELTHGTKISTRSIIRYASAHTARQSD